LKPDSAPVRSSPTPCSHRCVGRGGGGGHPLHPLDPSAETAAMARGPVGAHFLRRQALGRVQHPQCLQLPRLRLRLRAQLGAGHILTRRRLLPIAQRRRHRRLHRRRLLQTSLFTSSHHLTILQPPAPPYIMSSLHADAEAATDPGPTPGSPPPAARHPGAPDGGPPRPHPAHPAGPLAAPASAAAVNDAPCPPFTSHGASIMSVASPIYVPPPILLNHRQPTRGLACAAATAHWPTEGGRVECVCSAVRAVCWVTCSSLLCAAISVRLTCSSCCCCCCCCSCAAASVLPLSSAARLTAASASVRPATSAACRNTARAGRFRQLGGVRQLGGGDRLLTTV
jgi:hypothetical protein